jgi:2-polyprenyl-6-methoxyphenol hydroxylase-like FAD-dependent oxidoreductase
MAQNSTNRQHAIVMGGSLAGLLTARVLSKHFERVTIIEKDRVNHRPESRSGQPQTQHLHGLLATGLQVMTDYFPDLPEALVENGAMMNDFAESMQWYIYGGYRSQFKIGFPVTTMSRGLLEYLIRDRVLALPNIQLLDRTTVKKLQTTPNKDRIIGIEIEQYGTENHSNALTADLIIDATGRNSASARWLEDLGYKPPVESKVHVNVRYATRIYRRDPQDAHSQTWILNTPDAAKQTSFGGIFPIEGNRWVVSVGNWHDNGIPITESSFLEFVRSLEGQDIYNIISQCEPISRVIPYKFPFSLRRHYERLNRFPTGYLILGDAISSFNPTYGQGMTVAALEAAELDRLLVANIHPKRLAQTFFQHVAKIIDIPWQLSVGEDFRFAQTTGAKPIGIDFINRYVARLHRATLTDVVVGEAFLKVMNLMAPPISLFHPRIVWQVFKN